MKLSHYKDFVAQAGDTKTDVTCSDSFIPYLMKVYA